MPATRIVATTLETVLPLRATLSIPPRSTEMTLTPGDTLEGSAHVAAYVDDQLVGVGSVVPEPLPVLDHRGGWRIRGTMVLPAFRHRGVGLIIIVHLLRHVEQHPNPYAWSYAKPAVVPRYPGLQYRPTGFTHWHPLGGLTLLMGNRHTLELISAATGASYEADSTPDLGAI